MNNVPRMTGTIILGMTKEEADGPLPVKIMQVIKEKYPMPKTTKAPALQPLGDRVLITAPPREKPGAEMIVDGIIVPNPSGVTRNNIDSPHMVTVVLAAGGDCKLVKKGDRIVVRKPDCFVCKLDNIEHVMIREGHVVAVVS